MVACVADGGLREREDFQLLAMLALRAYCRDIEKTEGKRKTLAHRKYH